jgi:hypothetical protein
MNSEPIQLLSKLSDRTTAFTVCLSSHFPERIYYVITHINPKKDFKQICETLVSQIKAFNHTLSKKWCATNNPTLCIFDISNNIEHIYQYKKGFIGEQLLLFNNLDNA